MNDTSLHRANLLFMEAGGQSIQQFNTLLQIRRLGEPFAGDIRPPGTGIQTYAAHLKRLMDLGLIERVSDPTKWEWPRWKLSQKAIDMFNQIFK